MRQLKEAGQVDRLHHPQAARGARGRRPHHRDPPRQGGRRGRRPTASERRARRDDGRPRRSTSRSHKDAAAARRGRPRRRGPDRRSTTAGTVAVDDVSFAVTRGRDPRPSPACRATARPSSPRRSRAAGATSGGSITLDGQELGRPVGPPRSSTPASGSCPRTAARTGSSPSSRSPRTSCSTATHQRPFVERGSLQLDALDEFAEGQARSEYDVRTTASTHRRPAVRRQPAEGRGGPGAVPRRCGCWSPRSRPVASTSGRSSSSTSGSSPRGTPARRCSSCRPSSTRSSRWPTGSRCMYRGRWSASCRPTRRARCSA